jgi:protein phosphatase
LVLAIQQHLVENQNRAALNFLFVLCYVMFLAQLLFYFCRKMELLVDIGSSEAVNKKGLRRAKKEPQQLEQQDVVIVEWPFGKSPKLALLCVFDGHGGKMCGEAAREVFPRHLRKRLRRAVKAKVKLADLSEVFGDVFRSVDARLLAQQHLYEGCTATSAVLWSVGGVRRLQCANVGDSSAVLVRAGSAVVLSVDHKPSLESERARLRQAGLEVSEATTRVGGLAVSRALGDHFLKLEGDAIGFLSLSFF